MAEEQTDANEGAEESSTSTDLEATANPSGDTESLPNSTKESDVPFHQHPRWKEVMDERNDMRLQLEQQSKQLEQLLAERNNPVVEAALESKQKFTKAGMDESLADMIVKETLSLSDKVAEQKMAPMSEKAAQQEIDGWMERMAEKHPDLGEYASDMNKVFMSLSEEGQYLASHDPAGLELIYGYVKSNKLSEVEEKAYKKGVQDAYANKVKKGSMAPTTNNSSKQVRYASLKDLNKAIEDMSTNDYKKDKDELLKMAEELAKKEL